MHQVYLLNQVERRMAPLSKALSGLLLPHETFGTHLDLSRKTTDVNLEKCNFKAAGEILAQIWEVVLDKFPVVAEYVENFWMKEWISVHCRISQYLLQIVKCNDLECCGNFRTTWPFFPSHFLPGPIPVRQIPEGPVVPNVNDVKPSDRFVDLWKAKSVQQLIPKSGFGEIPYDLYYPSLKTKVKNRVCKGCDIYYSSIAACKCHRSHGCKSVLEELYEASFSEDGEQDQNDVTVVDDDDDDDDCPPVLNIFELLMNSEFVDDDGEE